MIDPITQYILDQDKMEDLDKKLKSAEKMPSQITSQSDKELTKMANMKAEE